MDQKESLKLFISYSHLDEGHIDEFIKHIAPLKENKLIADWYDRKIISGQDFQKEIDNNLDDADIICLFISANFLSSEACRKEKNNAIKLLKNKGIAVLPIILSACGWLDDSEIKSLLALPEDGKRISEFTNADTAWNNVYNGLKNVINKEIKIKQLQITKHFSSFLKNTELLSKAHSQKDEVFLDDIFIYPELSKFDDLREYEKRVNSKILIENFYDYPKTLIAGENQSGKTTLCKKIFIELRKKNFIPVYVFDKTFQYQGRIENRISDAYENQYESTPIEEIDKCRLVPIIDNFHFAKNKERHIQDLSVYHHQIIVVDDIFSLNFKDENIINSFTHFKIEEFNPSLRNCLIRKWAHLSDNASDSDNDENAIYKRIDEKTELVNTTLGKIFGNGIMPAHPFFILSIISTYDTFTKPLDQEITSQGYCYQAFIYMYLRKQGVKNDEVDTYINFLTEFAFFLYQTGKNEISKIEFNSFMQSYLDKYILPVKQDILLSKLQLSKIIESDNFDNYYFCYQYLYYFFIAKYLADHVEDSKKIIDNIIMNLHKDENAYITIFVSHHSKDNYILDEIILNAYCLFDKFEPATLSKKELGFFDEQVENIINAVLPSANATPEMERHKRLSSQDTLEQKDNTIKDDTILEENDDLAVELRRSIKTVEVMGRIIKNRAGSLDKSRLQAIFEEAMDVHLRILTSFFEIIKNKNEQQDIIKFISNKLEIIIEKNQREEEVKGGKKEHPLKKSWKRFQRKYSGA